jgi:hypothetical protein
MPFRRKMFGNKDLVGTRRTRGTFAGFSRIAERAHMGVGLRFL